MSILMGWRSTNRLVRRVRRHGAFATLFRSLSSAEVGTHHSALRLVMGQARAWDGRTLAASEVQPEVQAVSLPASGIQRLPEVAAGVASHQVLEALSPPLNVAPPARSPFSSPNQPAPIQAVQQVHASKASAASLVMTGAAPSLAGVSPIQTAFDRSSDDADVTWRRLQRIRQLHAQKLAATEAPPSAEAAEVQQMPAHTSFSATPPTAAVVQARVGERAPSPSTPAAAAQSALPPGDSARLMTARVPALSSSLLGARMPDPLAEQASASDINTGLAQAATHDNVMRSRRAADDASAPLIQRVPVEAMSTMPVAPTAGASEPRQIEPSVSSSNEHRPSAQRASLETAWPVMDDSTPLPVANSVATAHDVGAMSAPPENESSDRCAVDLVRQQVAKVGAQVATDSKVDVITPRRPPPFVRKAPATVQQELARPESARSANNQLQRLMVETEVGALPAELWRVIGEEAPVGNDRSQSAASRHDARPAEATAPVDAAVVQQMQRVIAPEIKSSPSTHQPSEYVVNVASQAVIDNMSGVGHSGAVQLSAATPVTGSIERQAELSAQREAPVVLLDLSHESLPHHPVSDPQSSISIGSPDPMNGLPAPGKNDVLDVLIVDSAQPHATGQPSIINGATKRSDLADEMSGVQRESTQSGALLASGGLPPADKSDSRAGPAPDAVPLTPGVPMQTVQLAPIEAASQVRSRAVADVAAMGMSTAAGQQEQIDVDDLAQRVYRQLRQKLVLEWERCRPFRY